MPLNVIDLIIIIILLFFLIKSIIRGAVREIFSLLALFLAGFYSCQYYIEASPYLNVILKEKWAQNIVAFIVLFLGIYLLVNLAGWLIYKLLKSIQLCFLDRAAGAVVGTAKAYVLSCFLIFFISIFPESSGLLKKSALADYTLPFITLISDLFPEQLKTLINEKQKNLRKKGLF